MFRITVMPEFFYRASMKADILKRMDPRIREEDDLVTQFMIHYSPISSKKNAYILRTQKPTVKDTAGFYIFPKN